MRPIVKIIGDVVAHIPGANYQYGHPREIIETLKTWSGVPGYDDKKYPLIALFQDIPETVTIGREATVHMIIATLTQPNYKAAERYATTFEPILYPLYDNLMKWLTHNGYINGYGPQHTKIDRLYWGREGLYGNEGNIFDDRIDCIEIQNLKLTLNDTLIC